MPQIWDQTAKTDKRVIHIEPVTRLTLDFVVIELPEV